MPPRSRKTAQPKPDPEAAEPLAEDETGGESDADGTTPEPERSDLQAVDAPCAECFPRGWPAQAYSVGCTHGTWVRETAD